MTDPVATLIGQLRFYAEHGIDPDPLEVLAAANEIERLRASSNEQSGSRRCEAVPPRTLEERFRARVAIDPQTGCHPWEGPLDRGGYGYISESEPRRRKIKTHRLAYELAKGPIPQGLHIDHLCRNRACCNPDHLEAVTKRENTLRGESPLAQHARKTHCKRGHEFTPENTRREANGGRACKACARALRAARPTKAEKSA